MNRHRTVRPPAEDLAEEFRALQETQRSSEQIELSGTPFSDSADIELAVSEEALKSKALLGSTEYGRLLAVYYALVQNSRMTFLEFVRTRFVPQHVMSKDAAGQRHYHAILKHILKPETADSLFQAPARATAKRLAAIEGWPYLDDVRLCDLTPDHVRNIISVALGMGYSMQTVKHIRNVIGAIVSFAAKNRCYSGENPALQVRLPQIVRKKKEIPTTAQVNQVLAALKDPERAVALMALLTGLNMVELCGLQWKYVNLTDSPRLIDRDIIPAKSIAVRKQWNAGTLDDVKSNRIRNVPVSKLLFSSLEELSRRAFNIVPDSFVFASRAGHAVWPAQLHRILKRLAQDLGMPWLSWQHLMSMHRKMSPGWEAKLGHLFALPRAPHVLPD